MDEDRRKAADERLAAALENAGVADGRGDYRSWMRALKRRDATAFRDVTNRYQQQTVPQLLESDDPLGAWIAFGVTLAGMTGPGQMVSVDASGRSEAWHGEYERGRLLLFLPEDRQQEALPVVVPAAPSAAQTATVDLLVRKKLSL